MNAALHNPGGKVKLRLADGVGGDALFWGENDCYRPMLTRKWVNLFTAGTRLPNNFVLWIGMNPSVADANVDDPTMNKVIDFSMEWGFDGLAMMNVCDYRATSPVKLLEPGIVPRSKGNLALIRDTAKQAAKIVAAWGNLDRRFVHFAVDVEDALRRDGHEMWCLGLNKAGSPKHPLYVRGDTPLIRFKEIPV